uniref:PH domain-containing protein n=1 Tax=Anopheles maculatus TaxID=74869 RepID=A0A182TC85_9DIPT
MKKFMTTKASAGAPSTPSPSPPAIFSFDAMLLQQAADRKGSSTAPERNEDEDADDDGSMPSVRLPPPTPTAILSVAAALSATDAKDCARPAKGSSQGRVLATDTPMASTTSTGVVKMCGYLKKKRNKMGGWRKLFFILQNQLLLSYSSRDDYEKKLAPFKDIINLVPGTVIIPTTGPRFTIETNSKLMYTFRCDDHRSCSEWIMALLDSLTVANGGMSADRNFSLHNSFQRATLPLSSFSLPSNCKPFAGIISRQNGPAVMPKKRAPQPPTRPGPPKPPRSFSAEASDRYRVGGSTRESNDKDDLNNNVLKVVRLNGSTAHEDKLLANESLSNLRDSDAKLSGTGENDDTR